MQKNPSKSTFCLSQGRDQSWFPSCKTGITTFVVLAGLKRPDANCSIAWLALHRVTGASASADPPSNRHPQPYSLSCSPSTEQTTLEKPSSNPPFLNAAPAARHHPSSTGSLGWNLDTVVCLRLGPGKSKLATERVECSLSDWPAEIIPPMQSGDGSVFSSNRRTTCLCPRPERNSSFDVMLAGKLIRASLIQNDK